ncbi:TPA: hypothetical protein ACV740_001380 [Escherichia coli]|uniref:Uncharacterized protein n=1 Tax=Escherichia coli TaxID=562 RepID=A0A828P6N0_ECOLX|nr:hypothetical protein [Escherichia coli]EER6663330.1 hypothetical protein [Escherichia coli]EET7762626.1 hypothetical protein [Escherichia coli]EFF5461898.1 hypothetical protein [Escherichia coli]EFM8154059.1 hypothetical protein [Escherichia coli]
MKILKGLTDEPETVFQQIAVMIESGMIISAIGDEECYDLADAVFALAQQYARSACDAFKEQRT